jgi:ribose 5-phosphate isomerase A
VSDSLDMQKRAAAGLAAELVEAGMTVGLGTGTTVAHLLPAIARRNLDIRCVSTSPRTEAAARNLGLRVESFDLFDTIDLAIDGADQVAPDFWLIKGGGAAHTREKLVAAAAARFVVIVDSSKTVERLVSPVPLELVAFGLVSTLSRLGQVTLRGVEKSPDGGVIADYTGEIPEPLYLAERLSGTPGVVEHGLFPPGLVSSVIVGEREGVRFEERPDRLPGHPGHSPA